MSQNGEADPADTTPGVPAFHYEWVVKRLRTGCVVPFLGAGVNVCERTPEREWAPGESLPSGRDLAGHLGAEFMYGQGDDLARVSQYAATMFGIRPLYESLRSVFDADYPPTSIHGFLARLAARLTDCGNHPLLVVTTNYDDTLERTFDEFGQDFDLVTYIADGDHRGKFYHSRSTHKKLRLIERPNEYRGLLRRQPAILKIHGAIDRQTEKRDSYVITEDHYIDFLARSDINNLIPITLADRLRNSHVLFLGYSLRDWNLRVILHRIWQKPQRTCQSWAIQLAPDAFDKKYWGDHNVDLLEVPLPCYVRELEARLDMLGPTSADQR